MSTPDTHSEAIVTRLVVVQVGHVQVVRPASELRLA